MVKKDWGNSHIQLSFSKDCWFGGYQLMNKLSYLLLDMGTSLISLYSHSFIPCPKFGTDCRGKGQTLGLARPLSLSASLFIFTCSLSIHSLLHHHCSRKAFWNVLLVVWEECVCERERERERKVGQKVTVKSL